MSALTTGIGSLPHHDPAEAAGFVLATADIPYLPQLPEAFPEQRMVAQWGDGLCGCGIALDPLGLAHGAPSGTDERRWAGARAVLQRLAPTTEKVKTQATGPVTLAVALRAAGAPMRGLYDAVVEGLVRRLEEHAIDIGDHLPLAEVVLLLDEPALVGVGQPGFPIGAADAVALLRAVMAAAPVPTGVHCCGPADWTILASLSPSWISWDLADLGDLERHAPAMAEAVACGTDLIWGVVPVRPGPVPADARERMERVMGSLVFAGAPLDRLLGRALFAPACGLAGLTSDQAAGIMAAVRAVGKQVVLHG